MVDTKIHDKEYWSRYNKEFIEKNVESSDYLFKNQYDKVVNCKMKCIRK